MVRSKVGFCDVSTLGKIDVKGPDSSTLLDFVYTNKVSSLKLGKIRYGLMLREDGHVMDDGTCARVGSNHFIITTTTAAAGQVMRHLEFVLQVLTSRGISTHIICLSLFIMAKNLGSFVSPGTIEGWQEGQVLKEEFVFAQVRSFVLRWQLCSLFG